MAERRCPTLDGRRGRRGGILTYFKHYKSIMKDYLTLTKLRHYKELIRSWVRLGKEMVAKILVSSTHFCDYVK